MHPTHLTPTSTRLIRTAATFAATLLCCAALFAERGDDTDRKSKNGLTEGTIDGVNVVVEYGSPLVKGRQIWGDLVPFGKLWRTGADEATTITFDADVAVNGQSLAAGTYALFTVPNAEEWKVVFNTVPDQWGGYDRDASKDALTVMATPSLDQEMVEALEFVIEGDEVALRWEKLRIGVAVAAQ